MTEAAARSGRRQRSLHCKPAEQVMIRERAAAAGKTVSRYVMELALADDPDRHPLVLTEEEQAELRDGVRELQAFVLALCQSAFNIDPQSACKIDPPERHGGGCPGSQ